MKSTIEEFRNSVENIALEKSDIILSNSGKDKAAIVLENIFKNTKEEIFVFANDLNNEVCGQSMYLLELQNLIKKLPKHNIKILLEKVPNSDSKAFQLLKKNSIEIKILNKADIFFHDFNNKRINFTIGDKRMFRLENDTNNFNALFCFNEPEISLQLSQIFKTNFESNSDYLSQ